MGETSNVAIVTGAASGIGETFARRLAAAGEAVVLVDREATRLDAVAASITADGGTAVAVVADLRDLNPLRGAVEQARTLGRVHTVCLNAGVTTTGPNLWELREDQFDLMIEVNVRGLYRCIKDVVPGLVDDGGPARVIITASAAGLVPTPGSAAYGASKAAAISIAKALQAELAVAAPHVTVTVLNPGMVKTNLMRTSAVQHGATNLPEALVEGAHDALNTFGLEPDVVAIGALDAADAGRFWALPPAADPVHGMVRADVDALAAAL